MRLAILGTRGIPAQYGGFETFAEQLAVRLVQQGHDVTVFCETVREPIQQFKDVSLRYVPAPNLGPFSTLVFDARCLWQARQDFDLVYMLGYGASPLCWLPRLWGSEVWINMDGLEWARRKWGLIARTYFRIAEGIAMWSPSRVVADASAIKASLQSRHRRLPPCDVIPYGCEIVGRGNPEEVKGLGLAPRCYYLVVCRFEPENHVKEIIEGFLQSKTSARLVLVGDHERQNAYVRSLRERTDGRILFTGPIFDGVKIQALRFFCRGYIHGHSVGGTNPSLLEAMGCGNTIIAHDNPFNREVLGSSGLFFSTTAEVSGAIDSVDSGKVDTVSMGSAVVERVKQYYTWGRIVQHYCQLLSLVSSESGHRNDVIHCAPVLASEAARESDVVLG